MPRLGIQERNVFGNIAGIDALRPRQAQGHIHWTMESISYQGVRNVRFIQDALRYNAVRYLVYDVQAEVIVRWQS